MTDYKQSSQKGFAIVEVLLIVVALVILGFTGWFVYHSKQTADKTLSSTNDAAVKSFDDCKEAAGSKMLETYPEQCMTKDGKSFTGPGQSLNYLVIKEWNIKIEITDPALVNARYAVSTTSLPEGVESMMLGTKNTLQLQVSCEGVNEGAPAQSVVGSGNHLYRAKQPSDLEKVSNRVPADFRQIGDYWYIYDRNTGYGNCEISDPAVAQEAEAAANSFMKVTILPN
jgi:hypothetical protein